MEVSAENTQILASPVVFGIDSETGEVRNMVISKNEPEWSVNFKKGIIAHFQDKMESGDISNLVAKAAKAPTGKCTILKHLVQTQAGRVCVSQVPVTQCSPSCKPKNPGMTEKDVPFTCLPQGRLAEHYLQKANEGQGLPELATKKTSYTAQVRMPNYCVHSLVSPAGGI